MRANRLLATAAVLFLAALPARADQILGPGRITSANRVVLPGGPTLGLWQNGKYTSTPDAVLSTGSPALDTTYASTVNPNVAFIQPSNTIAFCPALSCIFGPTSGGVDAAYFGKQRATGLLSSQTSQDGSAEEQTLAITTTVGTGYVKPYAASTAYAVGDNVTVGNATYRATVAGTTGANSAPPSTRPASLPFTATDGSVTWTWVNDGVLSAKAGYYNEINVIPGGGQVHGGVTNVQLNSGVTPGFASAGEVNFTNNSGTDCAIGTANCIGSFIVMGGTNKSTTGLDIHGASATSGSFATNWAQRFSGASLASEAVIEVNTAGSKYGVSLGNFLPATFTQAAISDASSAPVGLKLNGTYSSYQVQGTGWNVSPTGQIAASAVNLTGSGSTGDVSGMSTSTPTSALTPIAQAISGLTTPLQRYGFIGDGNSHPISAVPFFNGQLMLGKTLAQWQALVPQIGALTDEIDGVAIQAVLNAQTSIIGARIDLPPNSLALVSRTLVSPGALAVRGPYARIKAVGSTSFPLFQQGTQAAPSNGTIDIAGGVQFDLNGGQIINAVLSPSAGALFGRAVHIEGITAFNAGPAPVTITNAVRSIEVRGNTVYAQSAYQTGPAFKFIARSYDANTVGSTSKTVGGSFSYVVSDNQSERFQYLAGYEVTADTSPSAGGSMGGIMEGVIMERNRAYDGSGLAYVTNTFNGSGQVNYQSPLWTFRDNDYQGFGPFVSLSGVAHALVERNFLVLDQSNANAPTSAVAMVDLSYSTNVEVRLNHFGILSTASKATTIQGVQTDAYTDNVKVQDNSLAEDRAADAFVHFASVADTSKAYTNIERGTKRLRPNQLTTFARDDGGNQVSEGRVLALGGRLTPDNKTYFRADFAGSLAGTSDASGYYLSQALPTGLFRSTPAIISASNTEFDASQLVCGAASGKTTPTNVTMRCVSTATNATSTGSVARFSVVLEGN